MCQQFEKDGKCFYGELCNFAHDISELKVPKDRKGLIYKPCESFHIEGYCNLGEKCLFLHNEVVLLDKRNKNKFDFSRNFTFFFARKYQLNY